MADPLTILRYPCNPQYKPDDSLRRKIATHLATQYLKPSNFIMGALPEYMESWDKVRIADGGDCIRTSATATNRTGRDTSFVRVSTCYLLRELTASMHS